MRTWFVGAFAAAALLGCGHAQGTGRADNGWSTPVGYASAKNPANVDSSMGATINSTTNHGGTYDSRYNNPENAPSSFTGQPPPVQPRY